MSKLTNRKIRLTQPSYLVNLLRKQLRLHNDLDTNRASENVGFCLDLKSCIKLHQRLIHALASEWECFICLNLVQPPFAVYLQKRYKGCGEQLHALCLTCYEYLQTKPEEDDDTDIRNRWFGGRRCISCLSEQGEYCLIGDDLSAKGKLRLKQ